MTWPGESGNPRLALLTERPHRRTAKTVNGKTTGQGAGGSPKSGREQRLAAALRTNLRRRKAPAASPDESPAPAVRKPETEDRS